ncbi:hypothetical protein LWI29_032147 [Acer saccharum]|uniref:Zeta toxin domain-containing protein n=1 Tax=Acer saccharum TaxID=4024 RepID=A0AA39TTI8_ACESA|nr:hypothetical protein LWI29_032147 [Acer saccharum]
MPLDGGHGKLILSHILVVPSPEPSPPLQLTTAGERPKPLSATKISSPDWTEQGPAVSENLKDSHIMLIVYILCTARQLGFADANECPQLCKLAYDYLKKSKGCEDNMYDYFSNESEAESLYVKLVEEFDKCILSYFAFHWSQAPSMITQVLSDESEKKPKLKNFVMAATRKQRFEKVTKHLKVARVFSTLVEEMKAIGSNNSDVMVPAALSERSPVLLLMGGGMGAGKSTVLKDIMKESFWLGAAANAVVVEADAFKETDVVYKALHSMGHHDDMLQTSELVHQSSTDAASSLLVTALNEGRDVIMDGTLSWEPFVEQLIAMARNVHKCRYRMGVGYKVNEDGTVIETYWEKVDEEDEQQYKQENGQSGNPTGLSCWELFAMLILLLLEGSADCVENGDNKLLIDPDEIKCLENVSRLKTNAESVYELSSDPNSISSPAPFGKTSFCPDKGCPSTGA